jgi:N6-adenosine-specific RNA methylase IME4
MTKALVIPDETVALSNRDYYEIEARVAAAVGSVSDIDVLNEARAQTRALATYLATRDGAQGPMLGAQRRMEARIGQLLGEVEPGQRTDLEPSGVTEGSIPRMDRHDFRLLAKALDGIEPPITEEEWRNSRRKLMGIIRERLGLEAEAPAFPPGTFPTIVADPPWRVDTGEPMWDTVASRGHDDLEYDRMDAEAISGLSDADGRSVKELFAPDAHLYLWTTNAHLERAFSVARSWGFKVSPGTILVWCKTPRGVGLGDAYRLTTEFVVFCRRGNLPTADIIDTTWFQWPRGKHSAKPDGFYEMVERVSPGPYIDLFARRQRPRWEAWGHEAN